jgi:hypothetical protein
VLFNSPGQTHSSASFDVVANVLHLREGHLACRDLGNGAGLQSVDEASDYMSNHTNEKTDNGRCDTLAKDHARLESFVQITSDLLLQDLPNKRVSHMHART